MCPMYSYVLYYYIEKSGSYAVSAYFLYLIILFVYLEILAWIMYINVQLIQDKIQD